MSKKRDDANVRPSELIMKKVFEIALGVVTSIGGFLEIGSITTAAQAGALFQYSFCGPCCSVAFV
jgi:hypothetical protein